MIRQVKLRYFKKFEGETFDLSDHVVLAGANNSGKTTLIQALNTWHFALKKWKTLKYREPDKDSGESKEENGTVKSRSGVPITRKDFTSVPLRELDLLWTDAKTALQKDELKQGQKPGAKRILAITLTGETDGKTWSLTMEFQHANSELLYAKPSASDMDAIPEAAKDLNIIHVPPFSGIGAEETRSDRPYQELLIGQGKAGDVLRNLLLELYQMPDKGSWEELVRQVERIFHFRLLPPEYEGRPFILCEYLPGIPPKRGLGGLPKLDVSCAGSGFQQVLLLLGFFYARPSSILLLDEPDAHLHVILQKQIFDQLREAAAARKCQLVVATHSEVILEATSPNKIVSFYGDRPHKLVFDVERDQVREALRRVTAVDLLLTEESPTVLYVEDETDFNLLRAWVRVLKHPLTQWFESNPFWHPIRGRNPREARAHFFALRAIRSDMKGYLLLDGDNRKLPEREIDADGMQIGRWKRYEAETYLVHPEVLQRFAESRTLPLLAAKGVKVLHDELPPPILRDPIGEHDYLEQLPASKTLLPKFFHAADLPVSKKEYYQIAEQMLKAELPPEVEQKLNEIRAQFGIEA